MNTARSSFEALFASGVSRVRIPMLQRDYAQGRADRHSARVRGEFVETLRGALEPGGSIDLDFVFGVDAPDGAFEPLDGQQRLTTLFLLHWYLAARCGDVAERGWERFTWATRESARSFGEALIAHRPRAFAEAPAAWITDQPWFLHAWRRDPTVAGMLAMLDAIHAEMAALDAPAAWRRLVDGTNPAVSLRLLRVEGVGAADRLYVRMNSRGKPLTDFEVFKARFGQRLAQVDGARAKTFADRVDGVWSDVFWPMRDSGGGARPEDEVIDDELLRYLHFAAEFCAWRHRETVAPGADARDLITERFTGDHATNDDRRWLFDALDAWCAREGDLTPAAPSAGFFDAHLSFGAHARGRVAIYAGRSAKDVDLFRACCQSYGERSGAGRSFAFDRTLLLGAAVVHRAERTADFPRRLRVLRNLIEASDDLMTDAAMPDLVKDLDAFVRAGDLDGVARFNRAQVAEERVKQPLRAEHPAIDALEDHPLLRGALAAFDLRPEELPALAGRARVFEEIFADVSLRERVAGALLASGDYAQRTHDGWRFRLVPWASDVEWRSFLRREGLRGALMKLLDAFAREGGTAAQRLDAVTARFAGAAPLDWRFYFAKYPVMREARQGWYAVRDREHDPHRYLLYMLNGVRMSGEFWDPYLRAVRRSEVRDRGVDEARVRVDATWGTPFERHCLRLPKSGIEVRSARDGFALKVPTPSEAIADILERHGVSSDRLVINQRDGVDTEDRVARCAALVHDLIAAGL